MTTAQDRLSSSQFVTCVKNRPGAALKWVYDGPTPRLLDSCIKKDPQFALGHVTLRDEQIKYLISRCPKQALKYYADRYSKKQLDYCIQNYPWEVLKYAVDYLSPKQIRACAGQCKLSKIRLNKYLRGKPSPKIVKAIFTLIDDLGPTTDRLVRVAIAKGI